MPRTRSPGSWNPVLRTISIQHGHHLTFSLISGLHWWDLLIAGMEELLHRNRALSTSRSATLADQADQKQTRSKSSSRRTAGDAVAPHVTLGRSVAAVLTLTSPAVLLGCPVPVRHRCRHIGRRTHHGHIPFANRGCVNKLLPVC